MIGKVLDLKNDFISKCFITNVSKNIPRGTKVKVLDVSPTKKKYEVKILTGQYAGKTTVVDADYFR